jgi:hypothetical protein
MCMCILEAYGVVQRLSPHRCTHTYFFNTNKIYFKKTTQTLGGAIFVGDGSIVMLEGSHLVNNTATLGGGAYAQNNQTIITISNSLLLKNRATENGGALYIYDSASLLAEGSSILNNSAVGISKIILFQHHHHHQSLVFCACL